MMSLDHAAVCMDVALVVRDAVEVGLVSEKESERILSNCEGWVESNESDDY